MVGKREELWGCVLVWWGCGGDEGSEVGVDRAEEILISSISTVTRPLKHTLASSVEIFKRNRNDFDSSKPKDARHYNTDST